MVDGCTTVLKDRPFNLTSSGASLTMSFSERVAGNGWWFATANRSAELDPVRFVTEVSDDREGRGWRAVGASSFMWTWAGKAALGPSKAFATPADRLHSVSFDMRMPWAFSAVKIATVTILICMCAHILYLCAKKQQLKAARTVAVAWGLNFAIEASALAVYASTGRTALAIVSGVFSLLDLGFMLVFSLWEKHARHYCGVAGVAMVATLLCVYALVVEQPDAVLGDTLGLENRGLLEGLTLLLLSTSAQGLRANSRRRARRIVAPDLAAYQAEWGRLVEQEAERGSIARLHSRSAALAAGLSLPPEQVRQRAPLPQGDGEGAPIQDLDQLFALAAGLHPFLKRRVQEWAAAAGGSFPVSLGTEMSSLPSYCPWAQLASSPALAGRVKWARVKTARRAVEKVYRSYDCDVSRLLDCCRQVS
jgi:hypothetical protein